MGNQLIDNYVWVEKYRPKTIEQCILPSQIKSMFVGFVESKNFPNLLLTGSAGTGKTTAAKALCEQLGYEYILINGSDQRNIDTVRTTIREFASTRSIYGKPKCIVIDESDGFNPLAQAALRATMEEFHFIKFILTCNYKNKLIEPIHSRTTAIEFSIPVSEKKALTVQFAKRALEILKSENVVADTNTVVEIVKRFYPDNRRTLNELQKLSAGGKIDSSALLLLKQTDTKFLVDCIKQRDLNQTRQWVVNNADMDVETFYREFYDALYQVAVPADIPQAILVIAKYMYQGSFVADQEINLMAMFVEIMQTVAFNE